MQYKFFLWICLGLFSFTGFVGRVPGGRKWVVCQNSNITVNGTTNINTFSCGIPSCDQIDTLSISNGVDEIILSGGMRLNIQRFDCHNTMMTRDLRKTLKEKQFPTLHISFLSLSKLPQLTTHPAFITGRVDIEIAGVSKRFEVNYQLTEDAQKIIHLAGSRDINFSDFNLIPPQKLGGIIKTRDKLSVEFHLNMKAMD